MIIDCRDCEMHETEHCADCFVMALLAPKNRPVVLDPEEEKLYPKGVVAKALKNVAFQDDGLIQYKAEVMLRIFDESIKPLIEGRAKAMIVTSSRVAGLRYFEIIREKLKERGADYKVLYAFSDFVHPLTNAAISEHALNGLREGEQIEDRFRANGGNLLMLGSDSCGCA